MNDVLPPPTGPSVLRHPHLNRGSAFTVEQRRARRIEGLSPPVPDSLETQIARVNRQLEMLDSDLQNISS
jgi:malate dehydrogenase (oxaloacetate-decarboxylating)(NADP+)